MDSVDISVCCISFNHEKYIEQCIIGFLSQNFEGTVEFIIHDDASKDNTQLIIKSLVGDDPRFNLILRETNLKSKGLAIFPILIEASRGKYIALCEGDDFWTDDTKLQRQFNFLEKHGECVGVSHLTQVLKEDGLLYKESEPDTLEVRFSDILFDRKAQTRTVSLMYRKQALLNYLSNPPSGFVAGDRSMKLSLTNEAGYIKVLPFYGAVYRHHAGGIWSLAAREKKRAAKQNDYIQTHRHFSMPFLLKARFVWHHFVKTLPGDLRYGRIKFLWQTLMAILIFPQKLESFAK